MQALWTAGWGGRHYHQWPQGGSREQHRETSLARVRPDRQTWGPGYGRKWGTCIAQQDLICQLAPVILRVLLSVSGSCGVSSSPDSADRNGVSVAMGRLWVVTGTVCFTWVSMEAKERPPP